MKMKTKTPKPDFDAKMAELQYWVDNAVKAYLQELLDAAQRKTAKAITFSQGMGMSFFNWDGDHEYRRPGDEMDLNDMLDYAASDAVGTPRVQALRKSHAELVEFLQLIDELHDNLHNWIVGDMEPTVPPKSKSK